MKTHTALHLAQMWHAQELAGGGAPGRKLLLVDLEAPATRKTLPLDTEGFLTATQDAMDDMRDSLREHFLAKVFAYLVATTRGMGSEIMDPDNKKAAAEAAARAAAQRTGCSRRRTL